MRRRKLIQRMLAASAILPFGAASLSGARAAGLKAIAGDSDSANNSFSDISPGSEVAAGSPATSQFPRWQNWAATQSCQPINRMAPASIDELVEGLKGAEGNVRPVGSGHSFSPLVPTDDCLLSTDLLSGISDVEPSACRATILGGTRLGSLGPLLDGLGQAMPNLPDMDYPSLAGALATSTHGTGVEFGSIADQVHALRLVTPEGELLNCSRTENSEVFFAARTSLGALGVVADITLQNVEPYRLTETSRVENLDEVLEDIDARKLGNRHFEIFPFPHSSVCMTISTNPARKGDTNRGKEDIYAVNRIRDLYDVLSSVPWVGNRLYSTIFSSVLAGEPETVRTGKSYSVLAHDRLVRFREMEYTVPAEQGPACLRELMSAIRKKNLPLFFPLEYRYVKADDAWLSMFQGRDGCSISVHQYGDRHFQQIFAELEPIFWKYNGRPHWGKIHSLNAGQLEALYPAHWREFRALRADIDPGKKMLNPYLANLLGVL